MKYRYRITAALIAALVLSSFQFSSHAHMPQSLAMARGMTKAQITVMENELLNAQAKAVSLAKPIVSYSTKRTTTKMESTYVTKCPSGGFIRTTWSFVMTGTVSAKPKLTISGTGRQMISDWKCIKGWTVTGDPSINRLLTGGYFSYVDVRYYLTGGWLAVGTKKEKQSCQTKADWHYMDIGRTGASTFHVSCTPGGNVDIVKQWTLSNSLPVPVL